MNRIDQPAVKLYTVSEVAVALRCHPKTIRRRIQAGWIRAVKPGGATGYLISEAELTRQLEGDQK